ncbi:MAG TPA: DMT family transporter [Candidatus Saccharimonadales bacterium]|nr:DMT family transporter [Candidatus Saccharimonadales bacterium]
MDRRTALGVGLVLVSAAGFGSGTVLAAPIYATGMDWLGLVAWRFLFGAALAWTWVLLSPGRRSAARGLSRRQLAIALGLGTLYTGNAGTYYAGLETVPAALAGVLVYTYPVIVAVLSLRWATRLPGRRPWIALALAIIGVVLALGGIDVSTAPPISGLLLVLLSPVIYSVWIILSARLSGERPDRIATEAGVAAEAGSAGDAAVATAVMMTATAAVFALLGTLTGRPIDPRAVPADAWPGLVAIGFVASFLAIQTFYAGTRRIGAAQAALVSTVEPVYIVVLAGIVLDQRLTPLQLAGAALILLGVILAQTAPRPRGAPEPATPLEAELEREAAR